MKTRKEKRKERKRKKGSETISKTEQSGHVGKDAVGKSSRKPPPLTARAGRSMERKKPKLCRFCIEQWRAVRCRAPSAAAHCCHRMSSPCCTSRISPTTLGTEPAQLLTCRSFPPAREILMFATFAVLAPYGTKYLRHPGARAASAIILG